MIAKFSRSGQQGLSIIETVVAMTIMLAALGGVSTLVLSYQLQNVRNQIKSGGIAAAEQVLDQLRQCSVTTLPKSGTTTIPANGTATRSPCGTSIAPLTYGTDKYYSAQVTYCQTSSYCDTSTRQITIQVFYENNNVFQAETVYTALQ